MSQRVLTPSIILPMQASQQAQLDRLKRTWVELGRHDPLWAVATSDETRGGRWDVAQFFATGEADVERYCRVLAAKAQAPERFERILDFGCGVGRMSLAWSRRAEAVVGVDISESMVEKGRALLGDIRNVELRVNDGSDLKGFPDSSFDLVCSHICLQHIPWPIVKSYLRDFSRVSRSDGLIAFQLPARAAQRFDVARLRKRIVESLPFGLGRSYRQWRHGSTEVFEMHYTPVDTVLAATGAAGLVEVHREPDRSAGDGVESYLYVFRKRPSAIASVVG